MRSDLFTVTALSFVLLGPAAGAADLHAPLDALLQRYVDDAGRVAYRALAQQDAAALDAYLATLATADPTQLAQSEQIPFWINAYNARVLRGVLDGHRAVPDTPRIEYLDYDWTLNAQPGQRPG
jgi:hypothetical protein